MLLNMAHTFQFLGLTLLAVISVSACTEEEEIIAPQLVVEGWIEDGEYPVVLLGQTLQAGNTTQESLKDYIVRWGKVTLSDGETSIVLTGGYDKHYLPPYKYTTYKMKGEAGKTYTLTAEYQGHRATAVTTVPHPVKLDSIKPIPCAGDTLYYIQAYFKDPPTEPNRYALFSRRVGKDDTFLLSFWGVLTDEGMSFPAVANVYRGNDIYAAIQQENKNIYFRKGDVVQVKLSQIDEASYLFWQSYSNQNNFGSNLFFPYHQNLKSNINGGKGYWCGYGSYTSTVFIP